MPAADVALPTPPARTRMTSKQRWLAALRMQPVDRLPFWPKIFGSYQRAQTQPFGAMQLDALHEFLGSDGHSGLHNCVKESRSHCEQRTTTSGQIKTTVWSTPAGQMQSAVQYDAGSDSWHPIEFPVKTAADLKLMQAWYADARVELDPKGLADAQAAQHRIGDRASTNATIGESPLMQFVEWLAGIEGAHYLLADAQQEVEALFQIMHQLLVRRTEVMAKHCPADMLYMCENTSTTLISPTQYRQYCVPHLTEYAQIARRAGRLVVLHMCGHLKALLPDLARLPVNGFEAFTSPTLGNTTLLDGRTQCPDKCLVGGTNATLWLEPAQTIIATLKRDLDQLPHHRGLVVTSAGVMPPACKPETIREVAEWVRAYPARM